MPSVVGVHGIAQQFKGPNVLRTEWLSALRDGLWLAGVKFPQDDDLVCASYGDLFRPPGTKAVGIPPYDANDITDDWEKELLEAWWREAAAVEDGSPRSRGTDESPHATLRSASPECLEPIPVLRGDRRAPFIFDLKQVRNYLHDQAIRQAVRERVEQAVAPETRVIVGHSLGSVVAYECLCADPEWSIRTLVTLGSPLGIRNLIFDLLEPTPQNGTGAWPGSVQRWINIADGGDVVALVKDLSPRFGEKVENLLIYNGATAHDIKPYLTAKETGNAIATGLR